MNDPKIEYEPEYTFKWIVYSGKNNRVIGMYYFHWSALWKARRIKKAYEKLDRLNEK